MPKSRADLQAMLDKCREERAAAEKLAADRLTIISDLEAKLAEQQGGPVYPSDSLYPR